jgi:pimeloyl-ACP methyl ester carboxylesterase
MQDTQLTQNNSSGAGSLVAKTSDGLHLSVQRYGEVGNDEIVFIHGFGESRLSWSKQTSSSLTEYYRVVSFDLRGHGNSDKPDHAAAYASGEQWSDDWTNSPLLPDADNAGVDGENRVYRDLRMKEPKRR